MNMTNYETMPDLVSPKEAAQYLNMSTQFIYDAVKNGDIPARKLGNKIRIQKKILKKLVTGEEI